MGIGRPRQWCCLIMNLLHSSHSMCLQYQSKVWTQLLIQLNEKACPNFWLVLYVYQDFVCSEFPCICSAVQILLLIWPYVFGLNSDQYFCHSLHKCKQKQGCYGDVTMKNVCVIPFVSCRCQSWTKSTSGWAPLWTSPTPSALCWSTSMSAWRGRGSCHPSTNITGETKKKQLFKKPTIDVNKITMFPTLWSPDGILEYVWQCARLSK